MIPCYTCGKEANQRSESGVPFCNKCKLTHAAPKEEKTDFWPKVPKAMTVGGEIAPTLSPGLVIGGTWWKIRPEGRLAMRVCKTCGWTPLPGHVRDLCEVCNHPGLDALETMKEHVALGSVYYAEVARLWMAEP